MLEMKCLRPGFEPGTSRLLAQRSTNELCAPVFRCLLSLHCLDEIYLQHVANMKLMKSAGLIVKTLAMAKLIAYHKVSATVVVTAQKDTLKTRLITLAYQVFAATVRFLLDMYDFSNINFKSDCVIFYLCTVMYSLYSKTQLSRRRRSHSVRSILSNAVPFRIPFTILSCKLSSKLLPSTTPLASYKILKMTASFYVT